MLTSVESGYQSYDVFDLGNVNLADYKAEFRVKKADLALQMPYLYIPAVFHCKQRSICEMPQLVYMVIRRLRFSA